MGIGKGELRLGKDPGKIMVHVLENHVYGTCVNEQNLYARMAMENVPLETIISYNRTILS